jgi:hypothetical protein
MNELSHTPGPWINDNGLVYGKNTEFLGAPSWDIYDASEWPGHAEEAQANAKLIAAAPDLLEACRYAYAEMDVIPYHIKSKLSDAIRKATQ